MPLYWLCYRHNNQISVVIEPGASLIHVRMRAALADLDQGEFTEGRELDRKTTKQVVHSDIVQDDYIFFRKPSSIAHVTRKKTMFMFGMRAEITISDTCPEFVALLKEI